MGDVVPLRGSSGFPTDVLEPKDSLKLIKALYAYWRIGAIETCTLNFGALVAQKFKQTDCFKAVLIPSDAADQFVQDENSRIITGLPFKNRTDYITALQELHLVIGISNHYIDAVLESPGADEWHFSLDPKLIAGVDFDITTPFVFKYNPKHWPYLLDGVSEEEGNLRGLHKAAVI